MIRLLFLSATFAACATASAQNPDPKLNVSTPGNLLKESHARPLRIMKGFEVEGSPYYFPEYKNGALTLSNGKTYKGLQVKLNMMLQEVLFRTPDGEEMVASNEITRVDMEDNGNVIIFLSGFAPIDKQKSKTFYEVLESGKLMLLKTKLIQVSDYTPINSNTTTRSLTPADLFYISTDGTTLIRVPKSAQDLANLLQPHQTAILKLINSNDLKLKKEEDLKKIVAYYNSLNQ
jgi:hypothetical protein